VDPIKLAECERIPQGQQKENRSKTNPALPGITLGMNRPTPSPDDVTIQCFSICFDSNLFDWFF
jgi:hypothetical protein